MSEFSKAYASLNSNQKQAVDTYDGPLLTVAGPGTGKTQLLAVRVANILDKTDALPSNILCLTFTDAAAANMRERLARFLGSDAYKVAVHTFHSFGSEVMSRYREYFYEGAHFKPADELASYELLTEILEKLPHKNPLSSTMNDQFTYLSDIQRSISELKRAGLRPEELTSILDRGDEFLAHANPLFSQTFQDKVSPKILPLVHKLRSELSTHTSASLDLINYTPLADVVLGSLDDALDACEETGKTKALTAWKNTYLEKNTHGELVLKDEKRHRKVRALAGVYASYLAAMQESELYDYDDMILRVIWALETNDDLRFELQETYQYILIDEFQDTNDAQMRLVWNLTNNPASEGRPNIMVVGDDDQAIFRFQGAELSNILDFTKRYRDVTVVTLTDNYRSTAEILNVARSVIVQATERLETTLDGLDKTLTPHHEQNVTPVHHIECETIPQEYATLAKQIAQSVQTDPGTTRAVIARNHAPLMRLVPYLSSEGLSVNYERQDDALDSEPVCLLELLADLVHSLASRNVDSSDAYLPELLAHPAWEISPVQLWQLSLEASRTKKTWLEVMMTRDDRLKDIATWLLENAKRSPYEPLESMLDRLFGTPDASTADEFHSPLFLYFFENNKLETNAETYMSLLSALTKIRTKLREYTASEKLVLRDFVEFLLMHRTLGLKILTKDAVETSQADVTLLSAHKAKGLEFDDVYVLDAHEKTWGASARSHGRLLTFPTNLPLSPAGDNDDERLRLLYVALTRARNRLTVLSARTDDNMKPLLLVGALETSELATKKIPPLTDGDTEQALRTNWQSTVLTVPEKDKRDTLAPRLLQYKLSATHLTNFLDISRGGPNLFLLGNLLRFPQAMSPSAAFGSAIHTALQDAHTHLTATGSQKPVEDVLRVFERTLEQFDLTALDHQKFLERGSDALGTFLENRYASFTPKQRVEQSFLSDHVVVQDSRLTGALDLMDIDEKARTIVVTDYKTGKPAPTWQGRSDFEKIKLHHYEQQLMFYKILVENSRQFTGYTVTGARIEFVEPDEKGETVLLEYAYDDEKLAEFETLVLAVWKRIQELDFTVPGDYAAGIKGILAFESDLLGT